MNEFWFINNYGMLSSFSLFFDKVDVGLNQEKRRKMKDVTEETWGQWELGWTRSIHKGRKRQKEG